MRQFSANCVAALFVLSAASAGLANESEPEAVPSPGCGAPPTSPPESFTIAGTEREAIIVLPDKPAARVVLRPTLIAVWLAVGAGIGLVLWWQSRNRVAATLVLAGLGLMAVLMLLPNSVRQPLHQLLFDVAGGQQQLALLKPVLHLAAFAVLAMASRLAQLQRPLPFFVAC